MIRISARTILLGFLQMFGVAACGADDNSTKHPFRDDMTALLVSYPPKVGGSYIDFSPMPFCEIAAYAEGGAAYVEIEELVYIQEAPIGSPDGTPVEYATYVVMRPIEAISGEFDGEFVVRIGVGFFLEVGDRAIVTLISSRDGSNGGYPLMWPWNIFVKRPDGTFAQNDDVDIYPEATLRSAIAGAYHAYSGYPVPRNTSSECGPPVNWPGCTADALLPESARRDDSESRCYELESQ